MSLGKSASILKYLKKIIKKHRVGKSKKNNELISKFINAIKRVLLVLIKSRQWQMRGC